MTKRELELKRLEQYALALGLKVEYKVPTGRAKFIGAEVVSINGISTTLIVYKHPGTSNLQLVLYFLHELGHQLSWIYKNRKDDPKLLAALMAEESKTKDTVIPKAQRKLIYLMEKEDAEYRDYVAHELNIKLPKNALVLDKLLDEWIYRQYYLKGSYPKIKDIVDKHRELKRSLSAKEKR